MKSFATRGRLFATLAVLSLAGSTLLTGCFEKDKESTPDNSVCNTAATVVTSASGALTLKLADGTILTPSGTNWTAFNATAGQKLTIGYYTQKGDCGGSKSAAAATAVIGCITAVTNSATTGAN